MKKIRILFAFLLTAITINSQTIYTKTFGNPNDKPIIYLHGGPGYNSVAFEVTTAQKLSEKGFYIIIYDRRGEGRSIDENAAFNFEETFDDLNSIYKNHNLTRAALIGHSFGGIIATLYAEKYSKNVESIILVGAPISMQETFKTILSTSKEIYLTKNDSVNLRYIHMLENMDKNSIQYSSYSFAHAMQNGFYSPKKPTKEAIALYSKFKTDSLLVKYGSLMAYDAPQGFWKNEQYTSIDITDNLKNVLKNNISIFGLYGKDDGLYSENQILKLQSFIGEVNLIYFENCSHNVFIDQQTQFINAFIKWAK